jgi:EH domain-containing protein 1
LDVGKPEEHLQDNAYRHNAMEALRSELVEIVSNTMTPVGMSYGYCDTPLEDKIKWRPMVLILGNYSSGKSTLINELLGTDIQLTGQAPTDDSFTVITYKENCLPPGEQRDGQLLLNDPSFPFAHLKRHGQRFASHFKLKELDADILKNLAFIDTPGMLDSVAERDRGYDYQEVVSELASIADLILVLFDPHKAGTVRETYETLRKTLPKATFEDRVLFVLNRIDECENLNDFLRVYGTLCWNLSQMTGRKDIPHVYLTYANHLLESRELKPVFLDLLKNQRIELKEAIMTAPRHRLDNLISYIEVHATRIEQMLEAIFRYKLKGFSYLVKALLSAGLFGLVAALSYLLIKGIDPIAGAIEEKLSIGGIGIGVFILTYMIGLTYRRYVLRRTLKNLPDSLLDLRHQHQKETWEFIEASVVSFLEKSSDKISMNQLRRDLKAMKKAHKKGSREARTGLSELR